MRRDVHTRGYVRTIARLLSDLEWERRELARKHGVGEERHRCSGCDECKRDEKLRAAEAALQAARESLIGG